MSGEPRAAWLRLVLTDGVGGAAQRELLRHFGPPAQIFAAPPREVARVVGEALARNLFDQDHAAAIDAALAWAGRPGNHLVCLDDPAYPRALLESGDPPSVLYACGKIETLEAPAIAIVGSRNATPQGEATAAGFARALSAAGFAVVSGLALGIDAAAHRGALEERGSTIAVLGTGIDRVYPARNRDLAHRIAEQGLLLTEYPLGTPPAAANFPRRNRLISGLSRGVVVVEAAIASGSLITARFAGEQGREVFAVPGSIHSPHSRGCHRLIRQGAKRVETAADILEELGSGAPTTLPPGEALAASDDPVLRELGFAICDLETLQARTGLSSTELAQRLLELELEGRLASLPGSRYQRLR